MNKIVHLKIYDIQGRLIKTLIDNAHLHSGTHKISWDSRSEFGAPVPSGMYFYKLVSNNQSITKKMILMK